MKESIQQSRAERMPIYRKIVKAMWVLTILAIVGIPLVFFALSFSNLPSIEELENPRSELASEVLAADGSELGRYYVENRIPVTYDELSPNIVQALVATEDERFYKHSGIDSEALGRILVKTAILGNKNAGGGSTITQQLAKLLFTGPAGSGVDRIFQKLKEWIIAVRLERRYTKEEIIAMYLNKFSFLYDAYGIKSASETYFGVQQDSLNIQQAATLVGMLKNPSLFNPVRRPDTVLHRRMVVLSQMKKNGLLTAAEYDSLRQLPLGLNFKRNNHTDGLAPYFRMEVSKELNDILAKQENRKPDGSKYDKYRDGLRVFTTIDPVIQAHAEEAMWEHMKKQQETFNKHWAGKDPWTYEVGDPNSSEVPVEIRERVLQRLIRESDRYENMYTARLSSIIAKVEKETGDVNLRDVDIRRIIEEEKESGAIARLVSNRMISAGLAAKYRKVMKAPSYPEMKAKYQQFESAVRKKFEQPTEMMVFAYNDKMEADTVMSPLDSIKYHRMFLQLGSMSVDPVTGHVKSWVGGINHKYFQYDHVNSDVSRQVGSTFKPFIYATAIALQGISPCFEVIDIPVTILPGEGNFNLLKEWTPRNADGEYTGDRLTLREGLRQSKNTVSVYLMRQLGDTHPVRGLIHNMGIDSTRKYPNGQPRVPRQPSIALGAASLSVYEMTGAYTTFANNGLYNKPIFISRIEDKNGRVIYEELPEEHLALNPSANYVMVDMLRYAGKLGQLKSDAGGKTGTTNSFVDGWFMGITPSLVVGTWVGGEDNWIRFRNLMYGQGGRMAKPYFVDLIKRLEEDPNADYDTKARFTRPAGDLGIVIDCGEYRNETDEPTFDDDNNSEDPFDEDPFGEDQFGEEDEFGDGEIDF